ncbi:hypothetical protein D1815_13880 [Aquimarina sp. AD1]|uniref:hypothetical protein n=1 Tax=Aquimarina sp. (strain AD1) TaxID=1714848 RepID=UPI000E47C77E|nr:hypothetical protein [Aquimarina sp. AD1]AXT56779.1 hypothetical protein D1815_13880 [Aquimarina sp. AD1]RKN24997.1 hypothetical protein D7035_10575 [Aquimarina sp. AD1]
MKLRTYTYLLFLVILILGFTTSNPIIQNIQEIDITTLQTKNTYTAGEEIILKFKTEESSEISLIVKSSYGISVLNSQEKEGNLVFKIPPFLSQKRGIINYKLVHNLQEIYSGSLYIRASKMITEPLESYLGPTSITAGGKDYGMFTVIPSDTYDNPIRDSTLVTIKHQFLDLEKDADLFINDFIVWKNIYSYQKSGRILVSANTDNLASKEFTLNVFPAQAQDFELKVSKKHEYADGNQIVKFFTSEIKDEYGNTISDGRIVEFSILTNHNEQLRASGTTIKGVATGYMIHPAKASSWTAQAFIPEMADSDQLTLEFKPAVTDYTITFDKGKRNIKVGAILSFMNQIIPDGAMISLHVYNNDTLTDTFTEFSSKGFVDFYLSNDFFPAGEYTLEVTGMGITKKYDHIVLE